MADTILLVFEGDRTEPAIFDNIKKVFFKRYKSKRLVYVIIGTNILKLWNALNDDPDFDTVVMLQDIAANRGELKDLSRDNVSEIHLFFDFEGHLPEKSLAEHCSDVCAMLEFFDEETDHGKLWISYPMAEALKHTRKDLSTCFNCIYYLDENTVYKDKVGKIKDFQDARYYTFRPDWSHIIISNVRKAVCLVERGYSLPAYADISSALNQSCIFESQRERFILPDSSVAVLSSFPFFLLYYFGGKLCNEMRFDEFDKECKFKHIAEEGLRLK